MTADKVEINRKQNTKLTIYHGSTQIIEKPDFGYINSDTDYGKGFYTSENIEQGRSWAVLQGEPDKNINNVYEIDITDMNVLYLNDYGPLAWMAELIYNRYAANEQYEEIAKDFASKYKIDTSKTDIIIGYRAGGNYMEVVDSFLRNEINIDEAVRLFKVEGLGDQLTLKSQKAFNAVKFIDYENVKDNNYSKNYENAMITTTNTVNKRKTQIQEQNYEPQGILAKTACEIKFDYDEEYDFLKPDMTWKEYKEFEELLEQENLLESQKEKITNENIFNKNENINLNIDDDIFPDITDTI